MPCGAPSCLSAVWLVISAARDTLLDQQFVSVLYVILLAIGQHLFYLALNYVAVW